MNSIFPSKFSQDLLPGTSYWTAGCLSIISNIFLAETSPVLTCLANGGIYPSVMNPTYNATNIFQSSPPV